MIKLLEYIVLLISKISWLPHKIQYLLYFKKYDIHNTFNFNGKGILFHGNGEIIIKENSYLGRYSYLQTSSTKKIQIGEHVSISHLVYIYTKSNIANQDFRNKGNKKRFLVKEGDVIIGDYCWIGAKVFINPGITIGENSVIGANSVITRSLPANAISAGVPAKVLSFKSHLNEKEIENLSNEFYSVLSDSLKLKLKQNQKKDINEIS